MRQPWPTAYSDLAQELKVQREANKVLRDQLAAAERRIRSLEVAEQIAVRLAVSGAPAQTPAS